MDDSLNTLRRLTAALQLLLIAPAALFMTALVVRHLRPGEYEPAHTAQAIVMWFAARPWALWGLLIALPFTVLLFGWTALFRSWNADAELRRSLRHPLVLVGTHALTLLIALATLFAAVVVAIVGAHLLGD